MIDIGGLENSTKPVARALTPTQTRSIYKAAPLYDGGCRGEGRTIGISNFDGFRLSNLPLYYSRYGLPTPPGGVGSNVTVVTVGTGSQGETPVSEGDLDIQMVLGVAPLCNLIVYDGGNSLVSVLTKEANDNVADIITESYGWNLSETQAEAAHNAHLAMTAQGITYVAASGDDGTDFGSYTYPNYEPEVLLVGGTVATVNGNGERTREVGWSGSGGGWIPNTASFNKRPRWQTGTGVRTDVNRRLGPDVALNAAGANGAYFFYFNGTLNNAYVGTSFAAPVLAGMLALAEQRLDTAGYFGTRTKRLGRIQDAIYAQNGRRDVWTDITEGQNGTLPDNTVSRATPKWDTVTGWGAINLDAFVDALLGTPDPDASPIAYLPTSVGVFSKQGKSASGTVSSVRSVDASVYSVGSVRSSFLGVWATARLTFELPQFTNGAATVEIVANGPTSAAYGIYALNLVTGEYDLLEGGSLSTTDATLQATIPALGPYVSSKGTVTVVLRSANLTRGAANYTLKINAASLTTLPVSSS